VQNQLAGGRVPTEAPAATATVRYPFLHEGILRTFLARVGEQARAAAVYWKYGCWFCEETTRSTILVQSSRGTGGEQPWAGEVTLSAWGAGAEKLVDYVLETLLRIPVGQPPEVVRTPARPERPSPDA